MFVLNLLEPFSTFGRIFTNLVRPLFIGANNVLAFTLESFNIYSLFPVEFKGLRIETLAVPALFLLLITFFALKSGRLYCNSICPVGTLLGIISKISFFKIVIDDDYCEGCGVCEKVCKSECIDTEEKLIDFSRCVSCFNCFAVCPTEGLKYELSLARRAEKKNEVYDYKKREFIFGGLIYLLGLTGVVRSQNKIQILRDSTIPVIAGPASPPGSQSIEHFTESCTACHLCVSTCPTRVLQPSFLEYGLLGILQPRMDYHTGFCNYECTLCSQICPTGAILPIGTKDKKLKQLGKAKFIKHNCIVFTQRTECGACAEHCPTKAVKMVPENKLFVPKVDEEICIGCGACEYACPTKPYKAIYVDGNPVHQSAKKPVVEKVEEIIDYQEDFPF